MDILSLLARRLSSSSASSSDVESYESEEESEEPLEIIPGFLDEFLKRIPADSRGVVYECLGGKKAALLSSVNQTWRAEVMNASNSWKRFYEQEFNMKPKGTTDYVKLYADEYRFSKCTHLNQECSISPQCPVEAVSSELLDDRFFLVIGGFSYQASGGTPIVQIIDMEGNTCTMVPCMAATRYGHSSTHLGDGRILLLGGFPWGGYVGLAPPAMIQWDSQNCTIESSDIGRNIQFDLCYHTADFISTDEGDFVVTFGGVRDDGATSDVFVYNIATGEWDLKEFEDQSGPSPRAGHCTAVLDDNQLYIFGGLYSEQAYVRSGRPVEDLVWKLDCTTWTWTRIPDVPNQCIPYMGGQACHLSNKEFLILGGNYAQRDHWTVSRLNVETRKATRLDRNGVRFFRDTHTIQKFGKKIIVHGGSQTRRSINRGGPCMHMVVRPDVLRMNEYAV